MFRYLRFWLGLLRPSILARKRDRFDGIPAPPPAQLTVTQRRYRRGGQLITDNRTVILQDDNGRYP